MRIPILFFSSFNLQIRRLGRIVTKSHNFLLFCILLSINGFGQIEDNYNYYSLSQLDSGSCSAGVLYYSFLSSTSLNQAFIKSITSGYSLSEDDNLGNKLFENNYLGYQQNYSIYFNHYPEHFFGFNSIGYRISLSHYNFFTAKYSDDFYNLAFHGNKGFAGDTAHFSGLSLSKLVYQDLQFGLFKETLTETTKSTIYVGVSLLKGSSFNSLYVLNGTLFTEETGAYVEMDMKALYYGTDTNQTSALSYNGTGAALNFYISHENLEHNYRVSASINQMGFIRWNQKTTRILVDTLYRMEPIELDGIFDVDSVSGNNYGQDSLLIELYSTADSNKYKTVIPERIFLTVEKTFPKIHTNCGLGISFIYNGNIKLPVFYGSAGYLFKDKIRTKVQVAYGGYTRFQFGIGCEAYLFDRLFIGISTDNITGFIVPEKSYAQSFFCNLYYRW